MLNSNFVDVWGIMNNPRKACWMAVPYSSFLKSISFVIFIGILTKLINFLLLLYLKEDRTHRWVFLG